MHPSVGVQHVCFGVLAAVCRVCFKHGLLMLVLVLHDACASSVDLGPALSFIHVTMDLNQTKALVKIHAGASAFCLLLPACYLLLAA